MYGGKLPVHVRCLIDECANIGQIPQLEKLVATIRSREISACLVLQTRSQLKAIYKDNADTIVGNMDSQIFLGGSEPTTLKDLAEALGKETIDSYNNSDTRGNSPSYGTNYQKLGHELMSRDELAVLDGGKCILQLRGVRPFLSDKYDLTQHPNYKLTSDYDPKNALDIEKYLSHKEKIHPDDQFALVDVDSLPPACQRRAVIFYPDPKGAPANQPLPQFTAVHKWVSGVRRGTFAKQRRRNMEFFNSAVDVLKTLVVALGAGLGVWGAVNLMEGYGGDNPSANAHVR